MPLHKLSQKSFVSGQYDRTAQNQESVSQGGIVATGLSYAKNVLSSDKGELRKRLGTKFLKQLDCATVLVPFRMSDDDDAIIAISSAGNDRIVGYKYSGDSLETLLSVRNAADVTFPATNTWSNGSQGSSSVSNGDWIVSFTFFNPKTGSSIAGIPYDTYPGTLLNRASSGYTPDSSKHNAPQSITIRNSQNACCMRSIKLWFWTDESTGYQYKYFTNPVIEYSDDGSEWTGVQTDYTVGDYTPISYTPPQDINTPGGIIHIDANYKSKCSVTISQSAYGSNHNYWRIYFQNGEIDTSVFVETASFIDASAIQEFRANSVYTDDQLKKIKYAQENNQMFISCEDVIPYRLVNQNGELTFGSFTPANTSTIWSTIGGYPSAVALFQNRVWFGGFENNPTTVIASKFDDYETFSVSSPVQKDDYLNLKCNQLKSRIRNLVGGQNILYCFSQDGISNIDGGSNGLLATNENIEFILKNRMPAGDATPAFKDDVMLYSSSDGTKLYGVDFDLLVNRFQVDDLAKYAKDVVNAKITELHYINNEAKLVYGLTDEGMMFALLYEKGQYQGFFPLDFGGMVYDICPVKVGRDYKLLMVVFRDGNWYLEEKLDMGHFIDTSKPRMTDEEKKWATYDNLENNIALDCYQTYDMGFNAVTQISTTRYYAWEYNDTIVYTRSATPESDDIIYDYVGVVSTVSPVVSYDAVTNTIVDTLNNDTWVRSVGNDILPDDNILFSDTDLTEYIDSTIMLGTAGSKDWIIATVDSCVINSGVYVVSITKQAERGNSTSFTMVYPEFTEFTPNLPQVANVAVISEGRYFNATKPDESAKIYLPLPCHKLIYGVLYEALAILKMQTPYESLKNIAQIDVSVINTTHLELGTDFEHTLNIEKIDDSSYYDLTRITMNDAYRIVVSDTPEPTKNIILRSNKGVPFTLIAIDIYTSYSNLGGD